MKFKTNAKCEGCKTSIMKAVQNRFPNAEWSMELESADKVLEVHGIPEDAATAAEVEKTIAETGFQGSWIRPIGN